MRACQPTRDGYAEREGVKVFYEVFGDGDPTVLLLPTWSIVHSRHWKAQVAYLARHVRVVTFDGRGNGRSDRPATAEAYADGRRGLARLPATMRRPGPRAASAGWRSPLTVGTLGEWW
jgi:pimeloyl-ACP methyl ester carboxylesterase